MPASRRPNRAGAGELIHEGTQTAEALAHGATEKAAELAHGLTLAWHEIQEWQQDNEFILRGYRRAQKSWTGCARSVFGYVHNETVNIHSHLGGAVLFLFLLVTVGATEVVQYEAATWRDLGVFTIFLSSAVFCLASSAFYHAATCHSPEVQERCKAFDYTGIIVLTVGSFYPAIYYAFFCTPVWQAVYLLAITATGLGAASIVLSPEYGKPSHRGTRTAVFVALGLFAVLPVSHALAAHGLAPLARDMGFGYLVLAGALYIGGAVIYANRIPERWAPGTFDYVGSSHQIFHVLVVAAALSTYVCVRTAFEHRHAPGAAGVCA